MTEKPKPVELPEEQLIEQATEPPPEFPHAPGVLGRFCDAMTPDIPYAHKIASLLAYVGLALSGNVTLETHAWLQPRLYVLLVGPPGDGKTAAMKEVRKALEHLLPNIQIRRSFDSKEGLIQQLSLHSHILLACDEINGFFEKASKPGAGTLDTLLELYEDNRAENITKKYQGNPNNEIIVRDGHLAVLGGVQNRRFQPLWRGSEQSGQQSRFFIALSDSHMPVEPRPSDKEALAQAAQEIADIINSFRTPADEDSCPEPLVMALTESEEAISAAYAHALNWSCNHSQEAYQALSETRNRDLALRIAMIVSACLKETAISGTTAEFAYALADCSMKAFGQLGTQAAANAVDVMSGLILKFYETNPRPASLRIVQNWIKPEKYPGSFEAFNRAAAALIKAERLEYKSMSKRKQRQYGIT